MISALSWIPRGAVKRVPVRHEASADEVAAVRAAAAEAAGLDSSDEEDAPRVTLEDPAFASLRDVKLPAGFEDSDEEGMEKVAARAAAGSGGTGAGAGAADDDDDDDESDAEDQVARPSDCYVVVANTEDDFSSLEVHVYNEEDGSLYVHHDLTLPSYPLCLAWSDYAGDSSGSMLTGGGVAAPTADGRSYVGSFCAVGTFDPSIEIWAMDVMDPLEPTLVLKGNKDGGGGGGKKKGKAGKGDKGKAAAAAAAGGAAAGASLGHKEAVMGLAWNRAHRHLLASSSADGTAKVWDLDGGGRVLHTFAHHKSKVCGVAWNPAEASVLATASYDRTLAVTDARAPDAGRVGRYAVPADPEGIAWYPHLPAVLSAVCDDGTFIGYDCRKPDAPLWRVKAHGSAATSVSFSPLARGLAATTSLDKSVRLWDVEASAAGGAAGAAAGGGGGKAAVPAPVLLASKSMAIGQVFTASFFPNNPLLLAAGGSKGLLAVWDLAEDAGEVTPEGAAAGGAADANPLVRRFGGRLADPASVPGLGIRPRSDGQLLA